MADPGWASTQLIEAAQAGDRESITAVVHGAHSHVRRFAEHLCASPQDAEDAAQEALIILYRKIGSLRATGALASWMFRIVRNECLRRARLLSDRYDEAGTGLATSAEDEVIRRLEAELVAQAIRELPDVQRRVLIMRDVLGYPGRRVAETLGLSNAAMKSQLHRARGRVRLSLDGKTGAPGGPPDRGATSA
ncbi:ECF RNA polymerase sigma factor SigM [Streptosporangium roseum]|uniref:RNA polymerase, sigma-24 subunit, ECF subfamily n=1 Tax=Streptosporangium roseum (strain ATCC 12428 / DSM 43021 / JCM 3005 / KCTC 9067 / NCIMB 10171 / NRRL 2505 / NI 9100) TaxID=479432 RepID=D2B668_STRRD|nr:RNA polymerase, sigma-24 subunit, ECF subfamily [Streptosporangium roseum DSM 43021]